MHPTTGGSFAPSAIGSNNKSAKATIIHFFMVYSILSKVAVPEAIDKSPCFRALSASLKNALATSCVSTPRLPINYLPFPTHSGQGL
jgi:hypothetical protein